ncbi:hypothetical protein [Methylomonas methanica]|jgi:hypothetical protein|uniref:Uncharacterized protein n=1 Tax=Methylomonas methanica TaxID=421 RepID=A0A177M7Y1_METMH|nr:hypothetical protein [Methylomonas methanica]OAI01836.1 hypothetical protein A1332_16885 [Methylomonas methanica]
MSTSELPSELIALLSQLSSNVFLGAVLSVVLAGLGAFLGAYLRKQGEDRAMLENFAAIREQLKTTTQDTEEIKQQLYGQAWRSQQQWSAREQYYSKLLTELHNFKTALGDLSDYFIEPGSEHVPDHAHGERFNKLNTEASMAYIELRKLVGPAAVFLSPLAVKSLSELFIQHWDLANFGAICTADYVESANTLAQAAYEQVLSEAKSHLGITDV